VIIYIAGKFTARKRLLRISQNFDLRQYGHIRASWLVNEEDDDPTLGQKLMYAIRDQEEVMTADLLILDTLDVSETGGREVEWGMAIAQMAERWLVGPARNVFHEMANKKFTNWERVYEYVRYENIRNGGHARYRYE